MTTPEQRRECWEDALRSWNSARGALDGALARYLEGDPAVSQVALVMQLGSALQQTWQALGAVGHQLAQDTEATREQEG